MQIKTIALFAATAAALPTAPEAENIGADDKFGLIVIHSGSGVHNQGIKASQGGFYVGKEAQNATCDMPSDFATFYVNQEGLYLYAASATPQQIWVDRSGMGQGIWRYTTGAQPMGRNGERTPFTIDENNHLLFDGSSPAACPQRNPQGEILPGEWSIWWNDAQYNPGYNENCTNVALRAIKADKPVSCKYTESS